MRFLSNLTKFQSPEVQFADESGFRKKFLTLKRILENGKSFTVSYINNTEILTKSKEADMKQSLNLSRDITILQIFCPKSSRQV